MSARAVEISVAEPGIREDARAYEAADVDAVPVRGERSVVEAGVNIPAPHAAPSISHAAHQQAAQLAAAQAQVQLAQATNTYDETAEVRRENEERLEQVHAEAEAAAAEQQRQDEQKHAEEEQARLDEDTRQREEHEAQEQKEREEQQVADHAAADTPAHEG